MTDEPLTILPLAAVLDRTDPLLPGLDANPAVAGLAGLPYQQLDGPGFERLCFQLLVAEGHRPRFFGRRGQPDLGVDIVTETGAETVVHQCKNLSAAPAWTAVCDAALRFEAEWLGRAGLPRPTAFVYWCPHPLDDATLGEHWTRFRADFADRTDGVQIGFRDRHYLDSRLRIAADLVAALFSASYAEHFCQQDGWLQSPWTRVSTRATGHLTLRRFLDYRARGDIYVGPREQQPFDAILDRDPVLLLRGPPGSGKSLTGLALACAPDEAPRRLYYASWRDAPNPLALVHAAGRCRSLPSLFFLDDCQLNEPGTGLVLERLHPLLSDPRGRFKLVLGLRDLSGGPDLDETRPWLTELTAADCVLTLAVDARRCREVLVHRSPDLAGLSDARLATLHHQTGGDLLLLDEQLKRIQTAADLDALTPEPLYRSIRQQYFGATRELPTVLRLACLAQFDLVPLADWLDADWRPWEREAIEPLMRTLYAPPRQQFLHASLAELIAHALIALQVPADQVPERFAALTAAELSGYLRWLDNAAPEAFLGAFETIVRNPLRLPDRTLATALKAQVLADDGVLAALSQRLGAASFSVLSDCLRTLNSANHPAQADLAALIARRFRLLFAPGAADPTGLATIGTGLWALAKNAPTILNQVEQEHGIASFLDLIVANGTLFELFRVLQCASPGFRGALLDALTAETAGRLIDGTIAAGRSIGTLHLALRELGQADDGSLTRLEAAIGAGRFLDLIVANGTLFDLFKVLEHASPGFRAALLDALTPETAGRLIDGTIAAGRSIGTLHLALRELGQADDGSLTRLEAAIGAGCFLDLIVANGTLFELFRVLQYASPGFRGALLDALTAETAGRLIDGTIATGRSIGKLHLALRELGQADDGSLTRLEAAIGAGRFLDLIVANGTLVELFKVLEHASPSFRAALLDALTPETAGRLIDGTIAAGRSIEMFHQTLRAMASDSGQRGCLEQRIGIAGWWRLLLGAGTLNSLTQMMEALSAEYRRQLLAAAPDIDVPSWCALIQRGFFSNACAFVAGPRLRFPDKARANFSNALAAVAADLAAGASWRELRPADIGNLPAGPDADPLRAAWRKRITRVAVADLERLDFAEAVNGFAITWEHRPDLRPDLVAAFPRILPPPRRWPTAKGEIAALRFVLTAACTADFPADLALGLRDDALSFLRPSVLNGTHTRPLFLLCWNLAAITIEHDANHALVAALPNGFVATLVGQLQDRIRPKAANQEKLAQLALAGLLVLIAPDRKPLIARTVMPLSRAVRWLLDEALTEPVGFGVAGCAVAGIGLLRPRHQVLRPDVRASLAAKYQAMPARPRAVERLYEHLLGPRPAHRPSRPDQSPH